MKRSIFPCDRHHRPRNHYKIALWLLIHLDDSKHADFIRFVTLIFLVEQRNFSVRARLIKINRNAVKLRTHILLHAIQNTFTYIHTPEPMNISSTPGIYCNRVIGIVVV